METAHFDTLSKRLIYILKTMRKSQSEVARQINVKPQVIQYLCSGNANKSRFTYDIAKVLAINPHWLANNEGPIRIEDCPLQSMIKQQQKIPLLQAQQVLTWIQHELENDAITHWMLVDQQFGPRSFATTVTNNAMLPKFEKSTIIVADTDKQATLNDYVLVYLKAEEDIVFRQLKEIDGQKQLVPLNKRLYNPVKLTKHDKILGVVKEARLLL